MIDYQLETMIILPHLDDEFALVPIIKAFSAYSEKKLTIIYCAERNKSKFENNRRRNENIKALDLLGHPIEKIIYLNDIFQINDLDLVGQSLNIYKFLTNLVDKKNCNQLITLSFEGGHPDHDSLALIIEKIAFKSKNVNSFFVPAYNNRRSFILPVSVFRPLKDQQKIFFKENFAIFSWLDSLKIAFIYRSERGAFLKLMPFIFCKSIFSRSIYISRVIDIDSVYWKKSLSLKRYQAKKQDILKRIKDL